MAAKKKPHTTEIHGHTLHDDYFWLRERDNPEVIAYLEEENARTDAAMKHTEDFQKLLFEEMKGRIQETDVDVPTRIDDFYYYSRTLEGLQYPLYCRKAGSLEADEEILLDLNQLAESFDYLRLGAFEVSPDHKLLAYSLDTTGSELFTIRVKELATGNLLPDEIQEASTSLVWDHHSANLFYCKQDKTRRPFQAFCHTLGAHIASDDLLLHEEDEQFRLSLAKTRSKDFVLVTSRSTLTSEVHFLPADQPAEPLTVIQPRVPKLDYRVSHHGERFFIVTNDQAVNFKVMEAPVAAPGRAQWKEFIPHHEEVKIDGVDPFQDHLVVYERRNGFRGIRIHHLATGEQHAIPFPEPVYTASPEWNPVFEREKLRFQYTSLVTPRSVYDYHMTDRTLTLRKRVEVLGGYEPDRYHTERVLATAADGVKVPISLVYRTDLKKDVPQPTLLYGYGSYGISMDPRFSSIRLSLLDRGFIFALAHIRGGGEMGRPWYDSGKLRCKMNTFTDFIACAEHLITAGYTSADHLAAEGGSAGGLLMGAVANLRPDLFKLIMAEVPFVDVINTMLDASIPLTVNEYEEWGNPNDPEFFETMMAYSPYDNIAAQDYPHLLVTAGLNDPRVQYWEPAKWVAKLRELKTDDRRLLLKTQMGSGHGGASGRYDFLEEIAFRYSFLLDLLKKGGQSPSFQKEGLGKEGGRKRGEKEGQAPF